MPDEDSARLLTCATALVRRLAEVPFHRSCQIGRETGDENMTHEINNPHESDRSMPGSSSKVIIATAVALVAGLGHVTVEGHGPGAHGVWAWRAAEPVPGSVNTSALEGCPIESPDGDHLARLIGLRHLDER
jgi:hypothetical protein